MTETSTPLAFALQRTYGPEGAWPLAIAAARAQLAMLEELAFNVYEPTLGCVIEGIYNEAVHPTRWDFLGWQQQRAFERRFGVGRSPEVDLAFAVCRSLSELLGPREYQKVISAAWEAARLDERSAAV